MSKLFLGNNLDVLDQLDDNSIDSVVTDPPYGLSFMNNKWDYDVPSVEFWKKVLRVLKPGGHVLSFGGTRTYHRMVVNMEDAGFEIRDQIQWIYGSGFPKSLNIGKAIDKMEGNQRAIEITKGQTEWEGWGTALKPANEPICVARKPLSEKTVAENVLRWRTGGLNIDGCRIGDDIIESRPGMAPGNFQGVGSRKKNPSTFSEGRFPANVILECICDEVIKGEKRKVVKSNGRQRENHNYNSVGNMGSYDGGDTIDNYNDKGDVHTNPECPCRLMDDQSGFLKGDSPNRKPRVGGHRSSYVGTDNNQLKNPITIDKIFDSGGASRFFYNAKVSKKERNLGLDEFDDSKAKNIHPTCKPINLLVYLCRMITPAGGTVLDPFMGSGSTGIAAKLEGFDFIGMEMEDEYFKIAESRINQYEMYRSILKK